MPNICIKARQVNYPQKQNSQHRTENIAAYFANLKAL